MPRRTIFIISLLAALAIGSGLTELWQSYASKRDAEQVWTIKTFEGAKRGKDRSPGGEPYPGTENLNAGAAEALFSDQSAMEKLFSNYPGSYDIVKGEEAFSNFIMIIWQNTDCCIRSEYAALYHSDFGDGRGYELQYTLYLYGENTITIKPSGETKVVKEWRRRLE